jgi:hypothetical protein
MTVGKLIEFLKTIDADLPVLIEGYAVGTEKENRGYDLKHAEVLVDGEGAATCVLWGKLKAPALPSGSLREALEKLLLTSRVLLQNAEGCAANHYGADMETHGPPGWLADCANDIESAHAVLSSTVSGGDRG